MKILFVSNFYPPASLGGYEEACRSVADGLVERGHTVDILTSDHLAAEVPPTSNVHRVLRLRAPANAGVVGPPPSRLTIMRRGFHNAGVAGRLLRRMQPDVVLFWQVHELGRALLAVAEAAAPTAHFVSDEMLLKVINGGRDPEVIHPAGLAKVALAATGIATAPISSLDLVFCSAFLRDRYARAGVDTSHAAVVHHGVPVDRFHARDGSRAAGANAPKILYAGRLVREKGILTLVEAFGLLRQDHGLENVRLSLVGRAQEPEFIAELKRRAAELGVRDQIDMPGPTSRDRMPEVYARHDVFVLPAEWDEPFSIALLEAMAVGIPVVATARGGSAEILRDGVNAAVVRDRDAADLARAMARVLYDPEGAASIGRRAAEEVAASYSLARQVEAIEPYLEELVRAARA